MARANPHGGPLMVSAGFEPLSSVLRMYRASRQRGAGDGDGLACLELAEAAASQPPPIQTPAPA